MRIRERENRKEGERQFDPLVQLEGPLGIVSASKNYNVM